MSAQAGGAAATDRPTEAAAAPGRRAATEPRLLLAWVAIAVGTVYLVVLGGSWDGIYLAQLRVISVGMAGLAIAIWVIAASRNPRWLPRSVMTPAILAAIGSLTVSTIFSRAPRISLEYLGYAIVLAALYYLLVRLFAEPFFRQRLTTLAALLFIGISALFIVIVIVRWVGFWEAVGRITIPPLRPEFEGLTYGNPSAVLTLVALLAMPTATLVSTEPKRRIAAWLAIAIVVGVVALMSASRAGWFALGVTGVITAFVWLAGRERRMAIREGLATAWQGPRTRIALVVGAVALLAATVVLTPIVIKRAGEGGEDQRAQLAVIAIRIFQESPIVGTGPGTWVVERIGETQSPEFDNYIPHAHNLEAQTLAEQGIVGAIAGVFLLIGVARLIRSGARDPNPTRRRWAWAAGIGLLYFALHQLLDFYANMPAALFAAALPVAYLDATAVREPATSRAWRWRARRAVTPFGFALVLIAVVGLVVQEIPALQLARTVDAADAGDWVSADAPARAAAAEDPEVASYDFAAGLTASHAGDHAAAAAYFQAVVSRTDLPEAWLNLAAEQLILGRPQDTATSLQRALRLGWQRPAVVMAAGDLALRAGQTDVAIDALSTAISEIPNLAGDPWWAADPARKALFPRIVDAAIAKAPGADWAITLMAGQTDQARNLAGALPDSSQALSLIAAWSGDTVATSELYDQCIARPLDIELLKWCGLVAAHHGTDELSGKFQQVADLINVGASAAATLTRVNPGTPVGPIAGGPAAFWGTFTYRRPTPADVLVPSLVHLAIK
jgi:O-antigen ligase